MKQIDPMNTLTIFIPAQEGFDDHTNKFFYLTKDTTITLEHSLVSVAKWEAKHHKPFLDRRKKTQEEVLDYIKCMTIEDNIDPIAYRFLKQEDFKKIDDFINDPMTGTTFNEIPGQRAEHARNSQVESAELIYWEMYQSGIPNEWEHRHFNQLRALIRVCANHNQTGKKIPKKEVAKMYSDINAARCKKWHTKG